MAKKKGNITKVNTFIKAITSYLKNAERLEDIDAYSIDSLEKAYKTLLEAEDDIETNGILAKNRFGDRIANPSIKIGNDARIQINKLLENMDITHKQRYKKVIEIEEDTPLDKFLSK